MPIVSALIVLIIGMVTLGLFETILQLLRTYTLSHTTNGMDVELDEGTDLAEHLSSARDAAGRPLNRTVPLPAVGLGRAVEVCPASQLYAPALEFRFCSRP